MRFMHNVLNFVLNRSISAEKDTLTLYTMNSHDNTFGHIAVQKLMPQVINEKRSTKESEQKKQTCTLSYGTQWIYAQLFLSTLTNRELQLAVQIANTKSFNAHYFNVS